MELNKFFIEESNKKILKYLNNYDWLVNRGDLGEFIIENWVPSKNVIIHPTAKVDKSAVIEGPVYIGENVIIQPFSYIKGPAVILENTLIGKSSFIRDNSIISSNCLIGHSSEVARSIILANSTLSHIVALSDSIIGSNVNFGGYSAATTYLLNGERPYTFTKNGEKIHLDNKFGSIVGDNCDIGAYVQLNPGVIMERNCIIYPGFSLPTDYYTNFTKVFISSYKKNIKKVKYGEKEISDVLS
jgi:NDP-sugar pyrophosphorylase family protein